MSEIMAAGWQIVVKGNLQRPFAFVTYVVEGLTRT